ncbi:DbpA RNA binding domain-containing protein [Treponema sp. TIM-1]|uniref:DbpA RNA binding domain-containing protein n=1 Tax=Treponema sp. TIM-1 TaxID=2898417 RepID=UPI00397FFB4A
MASQIDDVAIKKHLAEFLDKIHTEADPELLNAYRSLIRREVSLFKRSYLSAYLLMLFEGQHTRKRPGKSAKPPRDRGDRTDRTEVTHYPLAEEESARLFIGIGRNRKVFPRELLGLINAKTAVPREDIGAIRILDNYSFLQVRTSSADKIIEALNGSSFRGRTLVVNYARNRKEESAEEHEPDLPGDPLESTQEEDSHTDENYHSDKEYIDN